jgi:hypothetical protein
VFPAANERLLPCPFSMDKTLLKDSATYVRDALVKASDGQYSEYDYLIKIFEDAILRG